MIDFIYLHYQLLVIHFGRTSFLNQGSRKSSSHMIRKTLCTLRLSKLHSFDKEVQEKLRKHHS